MSLPMKLTNRRQFLERSMLGFGSAFILPSLLASCTDHIIPDPTKPPTNPLPVGDATGIDWNYYAKTAVGFGLGQVPFVGGILSGLVGALWPTPEDSPWNKIKAQVSQFVEQKFDEYTYNTASGKLDDLRQNMVDYGQKVKDGSLTEINSIWLATKEIFVNDLDAFTTPEYEVILLPLYTQYVNLYLALLRDPLIPTKQDPTVRTGKTWGMTDQDILDTNSTLQHFISIANSHVQGAYITGRNNVVNNVQDDRMKVEPFKSTNAYDRTMTMLVLDYWDTWGYYDITTFPNGAVNPDGTPVHLFNREIYSDPIGNIVNGTIPQPPGIVLPAPATQFPTRVTVWGGERIDAVQVFYDNGGGPGGVTATPRMGDKNGGSAQSPQGGTVAVSPDLPIIQAFVTHEGAATDGEHAITTLQFNSVGKNANSLSPVFGGVPGQYQSDGIGYTGYALSSIYIHGSTLSYPNTSADCIIFGFLRLP